MVNKKAEQHREYDVIVVGAGMVGAAFACLLARSNTRLSIALLEARATAAFDPEQFDPRVAALTEKSRRLLDRCGAWSAIAAQRVSAYGAMQVWDAEGTGEIHFDCQDVQQPNLGHIVENSLVVESLLAEVDKLDNIDFLCPVSCCSVQPV